MLHLVKGLGGVGEGRGAEEFAIFSEGFFSSPEPKAPGELIV